MTATLSPPARPDLPELTPLAPRRNGLHRLWRGRPTDPAWVRPTLIALLAATTVLYLWGLGASGWANSFYAAAVQAGTKSWEAFFFGSSDSSNFITVDKPPAALWIMGLSARAFGFNAWSILVPQALEGTATVGFLYLTVRRWFAPSAALLAGAVLALTPVAALMFRFNNPDALLVLLLTIAAYATVRAIEKGQTRWLILVGTLIGFGFLTKMLQALVVVPVFAGVYLLAAPPPFFRRLLQLAAGGLALVVAGGWWVAAVQLTPAADRPYIGGSQDNNLLNLIFGYNGFGRLTGNEAGSVGGMGAAGSRWGPTGWNRLFLSEMGGQISWLIPSALILLVAGLWFTRRAPRTDRTRAGLLIWGGWLLLTGALFSFASGIIHPYYTVALAPAIGALVGIGSYLCWSRRRQLVPRLFMAAALVAASVWSFVLLDRTPQWQPWLRSVILIMGLVVALGLVLIPLVHRRLLIWGLIGCAVAMAGPAAYSVQTAATTHSGAIPSAGPTGAGGFGGGFGPGAGGGFGGGFRGGFGRGARSNGARAFRGGNFGGRSSRTGFAPPSGSQSRNQGGFAGAPTGRGGSTSTPFGGGGGGGFGGGGGAGSLLNASTPSAALQKALESNASRYTWIAATVGSDAASGYQLATNDPVMAIGGFNGTDPAPTLAQFKAYVKAGKIHYFISGGTGASSDSDAGAITSWVESHFTAHTIGASTVYDLTK
jgi:4-amino-4-deoxy-L-arabinose transferase-like glycosyltransferase